MKKFLFVLTAMLASAGMAAAQNALTVADITLPQNSDATLTVSYEFDVADTYTGYSFNLELPSELEFVLAEGTDVACTKGACHDASHSVTANLSEGLVKVAGLSLSSKPLTGTAGVLLTFTIKPAATLTVGQTFTGTIKDILIVPVEGTKQTLANSTFTVTIGEPADLRTVLDETSTTEPDAATGVDVRVKRTINAGEWSTICLPFAMTAEQVTAAFGSDVRLGDFNDYEYDDAEGTISVKFTDATAIEANHPYIIKVSEPVTEFTADGVDIDPQEAVVDFDTSRRKNQPRQFVGTYAAGTELEWGTLFLSGSKFWYSVGTTKMKAFRAYFNFYNLLPDFEDNYADAPVFITFDGGVTGVGSISIAAAGANDAYYNLSGQRVATPRKGIYIKNNKKVFVK